MSALHTVLAKAWQFLCPLLTITGLVLLLLITLLVALLMSVESLSIRAAEMGALVCKIALGFLGAYVSLSKSPRRRPLFFVALFVSITGGALILDYVKNEAREIESRLEKEQLRAEISQLRQVSENIQMTVSDIRSDISEPPAALPSEVISDIKTIKKQTMPQPPPNITWKVEETIGNRVKIRLTVDRPMTDGKFAVMCDRPCKAVGAGIAGFNSWQYAKIPNVPRIAAFIAIQPNPIPPRVPISLTVESEDEVPIKIIRVARFRIRSEDN